MKFARKLAAALLSAAALSSAHSLPDDRNQPIEIQANSADRSTKTGITTYTGNVDMKQGSIHVTADVVVLNSENDELSKVIATGKSATGKLATYEQQLTGPDDKVEARAEQIHFDMHRDLVILEGNGNLTQKGGSISGEHIEYDIKAEHVKAQAAETGSPDNSKRISVIIPPGKKNTAHSPAPSQLDAASTASGIPAQ